MVFQRLSRPPGVFRTLVYAITAFIGSRLCFPFLPRIPLFFLYSSVFLRPLTYFLHFPVFSCFSPYSYDFSFSLYFYVLLRVAYDFHVTLYFPVLSRKLLFFLYFHVPPIIRVFPVSSCIYMKIQGKHE